MAVKNVLLYACDALRWDELPADVADRGVAFKTVAQSTWSPPCFATLSTGLYPEKHGVLKFHHELADGVETAYDIDGLDGAYYNKHSNDRLADVFGVPQDRTVADLEEPFFYVERDLTTHAPYDDVDSTDVGVYLDEVGSDWDRLQRDYRNGVRKSVDIFEERLEVLRDRGMLEDTLVIFTADHGESLGEYGDIGHSNPTCPEIAYVPTVFMHPSLSAESFTADPDSEIIEQVDVVETALAAIGFDDIPTDGVDLGSRTRSDPVGYNYVRVEKKGVSFYESRSTWDHGGGHVFLTNPRASRLAYFLYRQLRGNHRHTIRESWKTVLGQYVHSHYQFGEPAHTREEARRFVDEKDDAFEDLDLTETTLSEDTEDQLREMGYLT